jgi:sterol desaturase/sphingolipid hydroxylase (fatty acid hydroxylase superfamily)
MDPIVASVLNVVGDFTLRLMPIYLAATVAIAYAIFVWRDRNWSPRAFFRWLAPTDIYLHPSHIVDIKLFFLGRLLKFAGLFNMMVIGTLAAVLSHSMMGFLLGREMQDGAWTWQQIVICTLTFAVVGDFCIYWVHRVHHEYPVLWPFHSVHHSAEVMTPVTVYRKHPVYDLVSDAFSAALVGLASGAVLIIFSSEMSIVSIGGANVIYVVFNMLGANFRHSHIWISYGRTLEHIFISPAQHQIHHSCAVKHHDKNYGEVFAIWDWMFGTLYVPDGYEELKFGLADRDGAPIPQEHNSLRDALIVPVKQSYQALRLKPGPGTGHLPAGE